MEIGLLKERKRDERRVGLQPEQVSELTQAGHSVYVETGAGKAVGHDDDDYGAAGAEIVSQAEVYERARLLVKVKCPLPEEYQFLGPDHILFTYLHFDENIPPARLMQIVETGVAGIAYEWVEVDGRFPLLWPMSELTGAVCARKTMSLLMERAGLLGGRYTSEWPASRAMVIGAGHIGANAINVLVKNCFALTVVDKHPETLESRLRPYLDMEAWSAAAPEVIPFDESRPDESVGALRERLPETDIVICAAVRRPTLPKAVCEYLIRREDVATMRPGSVISDATACDRDFIETCVSTESLTETYVEEGVVHYNCDHMPSLVAKTATRLLTKATFPYVHALCAGFEQAIRDNQALAKAVMCYRGRLAHACSAKKKNLEYTELAALL